MKKFYWFSLGVAIVVLFAATAELAYGAEGEVLTVEMTKDYVDKQDEAALAFVSGLARGAYQAYIASLVINYNLTDRDATALAGATCGGISPLQLLDSAMKKFSKDDVRVVLPAMVWGLCHRKELKS